MILRAALEELTEAGFGGFTMDSVAQRAGVSRSTLYRHWPDRTALVADAIETLNTQPGPDPGGENPRARVEALLSHLAAALTDSPVGRCLPALIHAADQDEALRRLHHGYSARRRRALTEAVADGVRAGDFPRVDPDLASAALAGAVFYRRLMTPEPLRPAEVGLLVDTVLG